MTAVTPAEGAEDVPRTPDTGRFFLAWWPDSSVPRIARPIGPGDEVYEQFWGGDAIIGHPERWTEIPSPNDAQALAEARLQILNLREGYRDGERRIETLRAQVAALEAGNAAMRAALEQIADVGEGGDDLHGFVTETARAALAQSSGGDE